MVQQRKVYAFWSDSLKYQGVCQVCNINGAGQHLALNHFAFKCSTLKGHGMVQHVRVLGIEGFGVEVPAHATAWLLLLSTTCAIAMLLLVYSCIA